jgi:hypothetical protein
MSAQIQERARHDIEMCQSAMQCLAAALSEGKVFQFEATDFHITESVIPMGPSNCTLLAASAMCHFHDGRAKKWGRAGVRRFDAA